MDQIIIVAKSQLFVKEVTESFSIIADVHFDSITQPGLAQQLIREKKPALLFMADDLPMDEMVYLHKTVRNDSLIPYLPIMLICKLWDAAKMDWILKGHLINDWISLHQTIPERLFRLKLQLQCAAARKEMQKLKIDHDYMSAELVYFVRNEQKEKQKKEQKRLSEIIDLMHYMRTFLTGIKGGASILDLSGSSVEEKKDALKLILKNVKKMDEYINDNDLTVKNEFRKKPPIKIVKMNYILEAVSPKIRLTAEKRNLTIALEKSSKEYAMLLHHPDMLPAIRSVLVDFVNASLAGSTVEIGFDPLTSANLMRCYAKNLTHCVDRALLQHFLDETYDAVNVLNHAESKFEMFSDSLFTGIQFYLPRLD